MSLILLLFVVAGAILSLVPMYWAIINSFQPNAIAMQTPPDLFPSVFILDNYKYLFGETNALRWFVNSTAISGLSALIIVYFSALAGYPLAKKKFPGVKTLFLIVLAFMTIPNEVLLYPLFMMMNKLNLYDSYLGILLPTLAYPFAVFLMRQFISTVPSEIFDAAEIDGCSPLGIFHRILLPIIKPGIGALAIFAFVQCWNNFIWQLIITASDEMKTLPLGVASISMEGVTNYGYLMAGATFGMFPMIVIFILFQGYFVSGITMGSIKG